MGTEPIKSTAGLSPEEAARAEAQQAVGKRSGIYGKAIDEPVPTWEKCDSEKIVARGENNAFIVLGRDRPSHSRSGFGGKGATQAGRVDLIAGLGGSYHRSDGTIGPPDSQTVMNPNFALDSARIYISQKCDLDRYMGITTVPGEATPGISGIGLKADTIRIHSRHDVKIVTGRARLEGVGPDGELLSDGTVNDRIGTISFIAGNFNEPSEKKDFNMLSQLGKIYRKQERLQPLVKGEHLKKCLEDIVKTLSELSSQIGTNTSLINQMNTSLIAHIHPFPVGPSPVYAPVGAVVATQAGAAVSARSALNSSIENIKINHLDSKGGNFINSKYVFTT
tara:strand:+ start:708 stop:1715 length:1008 start_codon:yes stop_codon:yes gene_type:complete